MAKISFPFLALFCVLLAVPAQAQTAAAPAPAVPSSTLTPEQAKAALETLQDDAKRKEMIDTLQAIAQAKPPEPEKKPAIPL